MRQGALAAADAHPVVQRGEGGLVERDDDAFGGQLAQRDLEPGAVPG